ncbi:MAG TPA: hypothetical protein DEQ47_10370 [Solibacterales bacterium]|nr:hypothetical protein [Bryobacterales bacterium]
MALAGLAAAQKHVSFPTRDGELIHADLYGDGERGVVLAHGFCDRSRREADAGDPDFFSRAV